jgi:hypothetical protein
VLRIFLSEKGEADFASGVIPGVSAKNGCGGLCSHFFLSERGRSRFCKRRYHNKLNDGFVEYPIGK